MATMYKPIFKIEFSSEALIDTTELLEKLEIPYQTLASRIRENGFPKPVRIGRNGKTAQYEKSAVISWLKAHQFRVEE